MSRVLSFDGPAIVVAEIAQSHDGSLGQAHAFIDAIAAAGAHAVKFQTHLADAESTPAEPWRVTFSRQDATRFDYWKRMEFSPEQWQGLKDHAEGKGLYFLSSPFSVEAVDLLARIGVAAWKVASGEVCNPALFQRMAANGLPFMISTGMSPWSEIDSAVAEVKASNLPVAVLQCTSRYPTPPEKLGLNVLAILRDRYRCAVGLSDHSGKVAAGLAAAALGATIIEVHVTFSREMFGPDVPVSLTMEQLRHLVEGVRFIETALSNPVDKDVEASELAPMRQLFTKSVVLRRPQLAGTLLTADHLTVKKPGTGIPADQLPRVLGRRLARNKDDRTPLSWDDLT